MPPILLILDASHTNYMLHNSRYVDLTYQLIETIDGEIS